MPLLTPPPRRLPRSGTTKPPLSGGGRQASWQPYWGKANQALPHGPTHHRLATHSLDVAAVAQSYLVRRPVLTRVLASRFGVDPAVFVHWATFWVALHDLGKFADAFQSLCPPVMQELRGAASPPRASGFRHDTFGHVVWQKLAGQPGSSDIWLGTALGGADAAFGQALDFWAAAVTGHHGMPPATTAFGDAVTLRDAIGHDNVDAARIFVADMRRLLLPDAAVRAFAALDPQAFARISREMSWWVAGLTVLADWIGSNSTVFRYLGLPIDDLQGTFADSCGKADRALQGCGVIPPPPSGCAKRFDELFPAIGQPSPLQQWAQTVPLAAGPQLLILEDVTGAGKTEAAAMLIHRRIAAGTADGFFIALPTMATANAMYLRIATMLAALYPGHPSYMLAHGQARLTDAFADTLDAVEDFADGVVDAGCAEPVSALPDETATQHCARWLADSRKRALLAPAGVGTIDQALAGVLKAKHQSLRLIGLACKVLVVDEVHACDSYMAELLGTLLTLHARGGGSAVLMSATLPAGMKRRFAAAFARGLNAVAGPAIDGSGPIPGVTRWPLADNALEAAAEELAIGCRDGVRRRVCVRHLHDRRDVVELLVAAAERGECAGWIVNTIGDAVDAHRELSARLPAGQVMLFHARFALGDRLAIESEVLRLFGSSSGPAERRGRVLIGTQVIEQSLDLDFDQLVSDVAPIDRLLQRAGRLRRHVRTGDGTRLTGRDAIDQRGEPCLHIHGPAFVEEPPSNWFSQVLPRAARVYADSMQIWRTVQALQTGGFEMPGDARELIEAVYGAEDDGPLALQPHRNKAEGKSFADRSQAQANALRPADGYQRDTVEWRTDTVLPTRLGDSSAEVRLATWDGETLTPWRADRPRHRWAYSTVRVAERLIAEAMAPDAACAAAIARCRQDDPSLGMDSVVLVLRKDERGWHATATAARNGARPLTPRRWRYDASSGLVAEPDNAMQ